MIKQLFDYYSHRFDPENFTLVMTILVKNEADIIEKNIRTHSKLGIDAFVIMDNNSTDGTLEILKQLKNEFEITIIEEKGLYQQAKFMTKLAKSAKEIYNADWIINNDADEFWLPQNGYKNLKEALKFKGSSLTAHRYNMLLTTEDKNYYDSIYRVENPVYYRDEILKNSDTVSIILSKSSPKVIINPNGLIKVKSGNHRAKHLMNLKDNYKRYDKIERFPNITVFHFQIRSYEQFEKQIVNRKMLLESGKNIAMGNHYRRWVEIYNNGKLKEEFETNILFSQEKIDVLSRYGIVVKDESVREFLQ